MSRTSISISRSTTHESSGSSVSTSTDEGAASSPEPAPPSASPTSVSVSQRVLSSSDSGWDPVDDIEPEDSASRPASRPRPQHKTQLYVQAGNSEAGTRESSRHREPAPDPPPPHRHSRRENREHSEHRHRRHHRHEHSRRRRPESVHSDSVGSHEEYPGHSRHYYPPQHRHSQWGYVQNQPPHPGYAASSVGSQAGYNPFTNPGAQLVPYHSYDPQAYYAPSPPAPPPFSGVPHTPISPQASYPGAYFSPDMQYRAHHAPMPMIPPAYYPYPMQMGALAPQSHTQSNSSVDDDKFAKLQDLLISQEQARVMREEAERKAKEEAEKKAAEAKAAKEAMEEAAKKAKESAEAEATKKAKEAQEDYDKKLAAAKKAEEDAKKAEKTAKEGEEAAKKEAAANKPSDDDLKPPILFKDAVGRKFAFPWRNCKTWKGTEELIRQAFVHVDVIGEHVLQGHYDLMGPNGEIILPQVWESTVKPDWSITMHMWPIEEKKPEPPKPPPPQAAQPRAVSHDRYGFLGRKKSKRKKESGIVIVPAAPSVPEAANGGPRPPPPPPAPAAPPDGVTVVPDSNVAHPSSGAGGSKDKRKNKGGAGVSPMLAWTAGSMGVRRTKTLR